MAELRIDRKFIKDNVADVVVASKGTGIFPSVKMAQAILESGWGKSAHSNPDINNLYGIKADSSWKGKVVSSTTKEVVNGVTNTYKGTGKIYKDRQTALNEGANSITLFRIYPSYYDSHLDHIKFLKENPRYTKNGVFSATYPEMQTQTLQNSGYATALTYASTLNQIIRDNGLKELDKMMNDTESYNDLVQVLKKKGVIQEAEQDIKQQEEELSSESSLQDFSLDNFSQENQTIEKLTFIKKCKIYISSLIYQIIEEFNKQIN